MKKEEILNFIQNATCSFTCIEELKKRLKNSGYKELFENDKWNLDTKKFYVTRNNASLIAFEISNNPNYFSIITTHSDTPSLLLKPNGIFVKNNFLKHNIMPYGGLLNYGWLDHPLSLSGRIIVKENNNLKIKIVDYKKPMLIVPSVAIHQNDKANTNLDLNVQIDLQPILALSNNTNIFNKLLNEKNIVDYDLYAYNFEKPSIINNEILVSPRIDNLTSVISGLESFINSKTSNIKVFCAFNNEEIGSLTEEGADSNFLIDILKRIAANLNLDISSTLSKSFVISSDNTHATHPNHDEYSDDTSSPNLNNGFVIIKEPNSVTNAISSSIIKTICKKNNIKYQYATARNDINGGASLSGISLRHVSVLSIDVGICQLAMHSSIETCSINDIFELYKMMKAFYETQININGDEIKID